jgi:hypothetical protein
MVDDGRRPLTVKERVLLHLHGRMLIEERWDAPVELSQTGVSLAVGVHRRHLPRTMRRLQESSLVNIELRHIKDISRRVQVYALTNLGYKMADELFESIMKWNVESEDGIIQLSNIVNSSDEALEYLHPRDSIKESPAIGRLAELVKVAYEDGVLTPAEERLLDTAAQELHVDRKTLERIKKRISNDDQNGNDTRLIRTALMTALADGHIDENEERILIRLARESGLDDEAYSTLVNHTISESLSLEERAYFGAMEAIDWIVDENNPFLDDLQNALGIDEEQHDRLHSITRAKLN